MKKKLFALLLVLALLVTAGVFAVQAETQPQADLCPHCNKAMDQIVWTSWSFTDGEIPGGHYYLAREYVGQTAMIKIPAETDVCLDLRGAVYFANNIHPFDIYGSLTVMDTVGNGQFVTTGKQGYSGGFAKIKSTGTLNILSGTIRRVVKEDISIYTGGLVYVEGGTMKMSGGALVGGAVHAADNISAQGGNIFMKGGSFEFTGGTISGGMAMTTGSLKAQGGNLFVSAGANVTINGGVIENGYSDQDGGNIFISGVSSLTLKDGSVTGGHAVRHGGNMAQTDESSETRVSLLGGTVSGGVAGGVIKDIANGAIARGSGGGGNYYSYCANGSLTISNCTIGGDMKVDKLKGITLSGTVKIGLGKANGLFLPTATDLDVTGLTDGSEIFVFAMDVFTTAIPEADAQRIAGYFKGAIRTGITLESDFTLKGAQGTTGYCPHCYDPKKPQTVTWYKDFTSIAGELHRYLTGSNISTSANVTVTQDVVLDLNGYTFYRDGRRLMMYASGKSLTVLDSFGGGKMEGTGTNATYNAYGGLIDFVYKGTFTLYSGTVRMTLGDGTSVVPYGGAIYSRASGSQVVINGGLISGGVLKSEGATGGGNIYMIAGDTLIVNAGIIKDGNAGVAKGGNIYNAGTTNIKGGFIIDGTAADGGNIYTTGKTTISGGIVYGGAAADNTATTDTNEGRGGNLYASGTVTVSGGTVAGGNARIGGNIYSGNSLSVSDTGVISAGVAATNGGNAYVVGELDMTGGTVTAGVAHSGGNFYFYADGKTATISGGLVTAGMAQTDDETGKGGNLYISKGSVSVSDKALISRGIADYGGGNVYAVSTLNVSGGQLLGGRTSTSSKDGGSVYLASGGVLNLSGGALTNGYASNRGGNVYMSNTNSKLNITGGTITGGYAYKYGGNVHLNNGSLNMTGGTVSNGRGGRGGNFCLSFYASSTATIGGNGNPRIIGGTAVAGEGGNIYFEDQAHQPNSAYAPHATAPWLAIGKCTISGGKAANFGHNIYVNKYAYFRVLDSFSGETTVYFHDYQLPTEQLYGGMLAAGVTSTGDFTGKLILENMDSRPFLLHKNGGLQIAAAATVKDGTYTWFADNAAMVAAYDAASDYMVVAAGELVLNGGTYTVDLAGQNVNITGTGTVYGMDSANDTYKNWGSAAFGDGITLAGNKTQVGDKTYFAVQDGNTYTFHRMGMDITSVSLRPGAAGLYYTALWQCDDVLAEKVEGFGVAVSLAEVPGDDFAAKGNSLYTQQTDFISGTTGNGVLVSGILNADRANLNSEYAQKPIYAAAYITVDGQNYTGAPQDHSLYSVLQLLSDNIYDYYPHAEALQSFMDKWADHGLAGSEWTLDFQVPEAVIKLQELYAGTTAFQGELHDHAATGGTSDGHNTLTEWLDGMQKLDMDFATIVDHKQYLHMELPEWDNKYFIGGSEAMAMPKDLEAATQTKMHFNMIFYNPMDLKAAVEEYDAIAPGGGFRHYVDEKTGEWHFTYLQGFTADASGTGVAVNCRPTKADMAKLVEIVKKHNGVFVHVHPKSSDYIKSTQPLDYWYADYTGLEVFYTIYSDRNSTMTKNNYKLWTDLLKLGKKVWATAGNDEHAAPANKALSTIYSTEQDAKEFVERVAVGNFTAGHAGVRMVVGDQVMGYETDFTGKELAFSVGDFHSSVYDPTHTYEAVLIADEEVLDRWQISCEEPFYHHRSADASVSYYRVEVYDLTTGEMLALGNPIWNTAK